jgi:hypothetical protein
MGRGREPFIGSPPPLLHPFAFPIHCCSIVHLHCRSTSALPHHRTITNMGPGRHLTKGGKPVATGKSTDGAKAKEKMHSPTKVKWMPSTITGTQLDLMVDSIYLPQLTITIPHSLIIVAENGDVLMKALPKLAPYEWVRFIPFLICSLGFLIHPFFRGLLHFYCLQIHHLSPNSILHIACFITLCEAFLNVEPHFGLWRKYFQVKL